MNTELIGSLEELALRILLLLSRTSNVELDSQSIAALDFISVYGADFGVAQENLNGYSNYRYSEFPARVMRITEALKLLVIDGTVLFTPSPRGFLYRISASGSHLCTSFDSTYSLEYTTSVDETLKKFQPLAAGHLTAIIQKKATLLLKEEVINE